MPTSFSHIVLRLFTFPLLLLQSLQNTNKYYFCYRYFCYRCHYYHITLLLNTLLQILSFHCSAVICSPTVIIPLLREASSETYGPGSIFHHISFRSTILQSFIFRSINQKNTKNIYFIFCLVSSISIRSHFCKWPWRDWQPLYRVGCEVLICFV